MPRIKEEEFRDITKAEFNGEIYYSIEEAGQLLKFNLSSIEATELPLNGKPTKTATFKQIMDYKHENRQLSDFDKKIIQGLNFNPKK